MPKAMQYTKGSVLYFENDRDERIFIVQQGAVVLQSTDIESGQTVTESVRAGEFIGVKSALGHFPREETAMAVVPTVCLALTLQEFELIFSQNKALMMKMLRVFSNQLRAVHKKTESILNNVATDQMSGMLAVAKSFADEEEYRSAKDVYEKFLARFPSFPQKDQVQKLFNDCKLRCERMGTTARPVVDSYDDDGNAGAAKLFSLPAFERFAKNYEPGQVIIAEYEPGDSFYLIQTGRVQLVKCVNGTKKNLDVLKPGELFGEMAILDNSPRSATCMAAGPVKCLEFNKANFEVLITGNAQIALMLLKLFCKRIYDQKRRFRILVIKDLQARLADVFMLLDEMNPNPNEQEKQRKFNVTMNDISHWAGLGIDQTKDEMNKMIGQRKVEVFENYIIVNNINDMKRMVESRSQVRR